MISGETQPQESEQKTTSISIGEWIAEFIHGNFLPISDNPNDHRIVLDVVENNKETPVYKTLYGCMLLNGFGCKQDFVEAVKQFKLGEKEGDHNALFFLANLLMNGICIPKDIPEAIRLYHKSVDYGNVSSMNNLGMLYMHGKYVGTDIPHAIDLFVRSSLGGCPFASQNLRILLNSKLCSKKQIETAYRKHQPNKSEQKLSAFSKFKRIFTPSTKSIEYASLLSV